MNTRGMNLIKINNNVYKYESFWRPSKEKKVLDYNNEPLPYPGKGIDWLNREPFVNHLRNVEKYLMRKGKYIEHTRSDFKDCLICNKKNITKGVYNINNIRWEDGLNHYIHIHKIKPSYEFIDLIFTYQINPESQTTVSRMNSKMGKITSEMKQMDNKKYLKIERNQLLILDALMEHGSYAKYIDKTSKKLLYSEHAGLLDFNNTGLERIIVKANTNYLADKENTLFPGDLLPGEEDYEYMFHTHPPTEGFGGRILTDGILYDFPSIGDILDFIDNYNEGNLQGSIVITPEGLYNIRKNKMNKKRIRVNKNDLWKGYNKLFFDVQRGALKKYSLEIDFDEAEVNLDKDEFYGKIAQDRQFVDQINNFLNKFGVHIDYYPRIKDNSGFWIIDTVYLPIYVVEPDFNIG